MWQYKSVLTPFCSNNFSRAFCNEQLWIQPVKLQIKTECEILYSQEDNYFGRDYQFSEEPSVSIFKIEDSNFYTAMHYSYITGQ